MLKINGKMENISNVNLLEYLEKNNYKINRISIEYNGDIIKKSDFHKITLKDEDKVEIVCFVGGG